MCEELVVVAHAPHDVLLLDGVVEARLSLSLCKDALEEDDEAIGLEGSLNAGQHVYVVRPTQISQAPDAADAVVVL